MNSDLPILIVDNSVIMRMMIKHDLQKLGYDNFIEAENGVEALKKIEKKEGKISLILLDWKMPEMTGLQFLQKLKSYKKYQDISVIMITAINTRDEVLSALKWGATSYILKPFSRKELKEKIDQIERKNLKEKQE
ncbi:response regulator [Candidatus Aerophobetes bacterium]|nr:response regulator [Candidatus Aerophobetes bacterium]